MIKHTEAPSLRNRKSRICAVAMSALAVLISLCGDARAAEEKAKALPVDRSVKILHRSYGNTVTFYAVLTNCSEATINLNLTLQNMTASAGLPLTVDAAGRRLFDLLTIRPIDPNHRWSFASRYHFEIGRRYFGEHRSFAYALPYTNQTFKVIQGPLGNFSHRAGSQWENAVDFEMPVGATVCAARNGTVVAIRQDSDVGGPELKFEPCCNYVTIRHDDGTFAMYSHLEKDSAMVKLGQKINIRDPLALSGNTGHSTGPHLHFDVFCTIDGETRRTIPIQFMTKPGVVESLKEGEAYP